MGIVMGKSDNSTTRGMVVLLLVAMVLGVLIGLMFSQSAGMARAPEGLQGKMGEVVQLVEDEYVDAVDADSVGERLIAVMLRELDPHSTYLSSRETERADEMMRGSFEGVGLVLHREGDTTYVGRVIDDEPGIRRMTLFTMHSSFVIARSLLESALGDQTDAFIADAAANGLDLKKLPKSAKKKGRH